MLENPQLEIKLTLADIQIQMNILAYHYHYWFKEFMLALSQIAVSN